MTASTINGRDQITAATLGGGAHTTASYLGETQTTMLTANNGVFTTSFTSTLLGLTRQTGNGITVSFVRTPDVSSSPPPPAAAAPTTSPTTSAPQWVSSPARG